MAIQLYHSPCPQDGRHSHYVRETNFLLKFNRKLLMSPWSREREDQRRHELSAHHWIPGCKACERHSGKSGYETHMPFCLRPTLFSYHLASVPLIRSLYEVAQFSLFPLSFINIYAWASSPKGHVHQWQVTDRYLRCLNGAPQANSTLGKHLLRPSYAANTAIIRPHYSSSREANQSLY